MEEVHYGIGRKAGKARHGTAQHEKTRKGKARQGREDQRVGREEGRDARRTNKWVERKEGSKPPTHQPL
jgi:hypothetical protein